MELTTCGSIKCQQEEQCDACFLEDHLKECAGCTEYDHPTKDKGEGVTSKKPE